MHRRSLSYTYLRWRPGKKSDLGDLSACYGSSVLAHFRAYAAFMQGIPVVDQKHGRFVMIEAVATFGRTVLVTIESGSYGEPGNTRNVRTGTVSHQRTADDAAAIRSRLVMYLPPGSEAAVFAVESVAGAAGGPHIIDSFHKALVDRWDTDYWPLERVYERDDWLALSNLKKLTAVYYKWKRDIGSEGGLIPKRKLIGRMEQSLFPELDGGSLPKEIWSAVRAQPLNAAKVMGFELSSGDEQTELDPDVLIAHVENGGRTRTVELGHESVPTVRVVISESGNPAPSDEDLVKRSIEESAGLLMGSHAVNANTSHAVGDWTQTDMGMTWGGYAQDDEQEFDENRVLLGNL
jgi:hypothetical protein